MCMSVNSKSHNQLNSLEARHGTEKKLNNGERADKISKEKVYIADFLALTTHYAKLSRSYRFLHENLKSSRV